MKRLNYLMNRKANLCESSIVLPDKRGRHVPGNKKYPQGTIDAISDFLNKIPKYTSHHSFSNKVYFHPTLSWKKLHEEFCKQNTDLEVSFNLFKSEADKYNVKIYIPKKDTCSYCDLYNVKLKGPFSPEERASLLEESINHKNSAEFAHECLKINEKMSKNENSSLLCFTFDLGRTQPIPYLNTSVVLYKRQMWLYTLGINTRHNNKGHVCIWQETEGKRGSNEVVSCLYAFLQSIDLSKYLEIHSFSYGCSGQNWNKTLITFFMYVCQSTHIQSWTHTFLESGHLFLPNDTDFGKIERAKNANVSIFTADDWRSVIRQCNFNILDMKGKFVDFSDFQNSLTFREVNTASEKFLFSQLKWMRVTKGKECVLEYKTTNDPNAEIKQIDFSKQCGSPLSSHKLEPLYSDGVNLSLEKYQDLLSILPYVPQVNHDYFTSLPHDNWENNSATEPIPDEETDD